MNQRRKVPARQLKVVAGVTVLVVLVVAVSSVLGWPWTVLLTRVEMPEFKLERTSLSRWYCMDGQTRLKVIQHWRHVETGALLEVGYGKFLSSEDAIAACQYDLMVTAIAERAGSSSDKAIGDECWWWEGCNGTRFLFRSGSIVVCVHMNREDGLPENALELTEDVATRILRHIR